MRLPTDTCELVRAAHASLRAAEVLSLSGDSIRTIRFFAHETRAGFGSRFCISASSVKLWESVGVYWHIDHRYWRQYRAGLLGVLEELSARPVIGALILEIEDEIANCRFSETDKSIVWRL